MVGRREWREVGMEFRGRVVGMGMVWGSFVGGLGVL